MNRLAHEAFRPSTALDRLVVIVSSNPPVVQQTNASNTMFFCEVARSCSALHTALVGGRENATLNPLILPGGQEGMRCKFSKNTSY